MATLRKFMKIPLYTYGKEVFKCILAGIGSRLEESVIFLRGRNFSIGFLALEVKVWAIGLTANSKTRIS